MSKSESESMANDEVRIIPDTRYPTPANYRIAIITAPCV
jgi:hypothetical protein